MAVALGLIEQIGAHLQQVLGTAACGDGAMKSLVPHIPDIEDFFAGLYIHHFGQGMGLGHDLRFPRIIAALDGEAHDHGFKVRASIIDILKLLQRHGRNPIALLADDHHQMLCHELRQRLA